MVVLKWSGVFGGIFNIILALSEAVGLTQKRGLQSKVEVVELRCGLAFSEPLFALDLPEACRGRFGSKILGLALIFFWKNTENNKVLFIEFSNICF